MTIQTTGQIPILPSTAKNPDVRTQFAALCYRVVKDKLEILMITSRDTGRWLVPKGWPIEGKTPEDCALTEAWEEAGVRGKVTGGCLGMFSYHKDVSPDESLPCAAMVYPVKVKSLEDRYPEASERRRKWMRPKKAAARVEEPELAEIIRRFDPKSLQGPDGSLDA